MRPSLGIAVVAIAAVAARLLFLGSPVRADEAGLVMVGAQWDSGDSLYGDYWIDRPPGLIAIGALADALGGVGALRVFAAVAAASAVAAAGWLGARVAPDQRHAPIACAVTVAALISHPLLDVDEISAEILALPLLLVGLVAVVAVVLDGPATTSWAVAAGAAGSAATLMKQNLVEIWLAIAVVVVFAIKGGDYRRAIRVASAFLCGAILTAVPLLALAWSRGTSMPQLWDAVVVFRFQAGDVIAQQASSPTQERALELALAAVAAGVPVLLLLLTRLRWRTNPDDTPGTEPVLSWTCVALLSWEGLGIAAGGSYWLHYLLLPVPGLALLVAVSRRHTPPRRDSASAGDRLSRWVITPVVLSSLIGLAVVLMHPTPRPPEDQAVIDYLNAHRDQGSTGVVAFGNPVILYEAGMSSPYEHLWSLPVRARDPELRDLSRLLRSADRPHWVVQLGESLTTWGIDASDADRVLERHYRPVYTTERYTIYRSSATG